jgi:hypothetical protein
VAASYLPNALLPFSDDFAGGLYVFRLDDGESQESVHYWNIEDGLVNTGIANIFEFVARYAYEPA